MQLVVMLEMVIQVLLVEQTQEMEDMVLDKHTLVLLVVKV